MQEKLILLKKDFILIFHDLFFKIYVKNGSWKKRVISPLLEYLSYAIPVYYTMPIFKNDKRLVPSETLRTLLDT